MAAWRIDLRVDHRLMWEQVWDVGGAQFSTEEQATLFSLMLVAEGHRSADVKPALSRRALAARRGIEEYARRELSKCGPGTIETEWIRHDGPELQSFLRATLRPAEQKREG